MTTVPTMTGTVAEMDDDAVAALLASLRHKVPDQVVANQISKQTADSIKRIRDATNQPPSKKQKTDRI